MGIEPTMALYWKTKTVERANVAGQAKQPICLLCHVAGFADQAGHQPRYPSIITLFCLFYWIVSFRPCLNSTRITVNIFITELYCPHGSIMATTTFGKATVNND